MPPTTIANVRDWAQLALNDPLGAVWPDSTVDAWVIEAIRDFSSHFKRMMTKTIDCVADQHEYELPYHIREIVMVEYPAGQDPPEYLDLLTRKDPRFWLDTCYYDFEPAYQETGTTSVYFPRLWISAAPQATQDIVLTFHAHYYDANNCLVPDEHIPLLILFVQWKALVHRLNTEVQAPDYSNAIITELRGAVTQARDTYEKAMQQAAALASRGRATEPWRLDDRDRIY